MSRRRRSSRGRKFPFRLLSHSSSLRAGGGFGDRKSQDSTSPRAGKPLATQAWVHVLPGCLSSIPEPHAAASSRMQCLRGTRTRKEGRRGRPGTAMGCRGLFPAHSALLRTVPTGFPRTTRPARPPDHRPQPWGGRAGHSRPTNMARALGLSACPPLVFQGSFLWPSVPRPHLPSVPPALGPLGEDAGASRFLPVLPSVLPRLTQAGFVLELAGERPAPQTWRARSTQSQPALRPVKGRRPRSPHVCHVSASGPAKPMLLPPVPGERTCREESPATGSAHPRSGTLPPT